MFQLYRGGQFYWWRKQEYPEKTTDLSQILAILFNLWKSAPKHFKLFGLLIFRFWSVPDEGYSERTWWRLFKKRVMRTKYAFQA
jgi:hypothetical protein